MALTVWKGVLAFAGLSVPIKLSSAARSESIALNQLHSTDLSRIYNTVECAKEGKPIPRSELVSAYEYEPNRYVVVDDEDIKAAKPRSKDRIELVQFITAIDPTYIESHYHVSPDGQDDQDETAYATFFAALKKAKRIGIGEICMYRRESVVAVRAGRTGILLDTLYAANEVRHLGEFRTNCPDPRSRGVLDLCRLMRKHTSEFEPDVFVDKFRVNLMATIRKKAEKQGVLVSDKGSKVA